MVEKRNSEAEQGGTYLGNPSTGEVAAGESQSSRSEREKKASLMILDYPSHIGNKF